VRFRGFIVSLLDRAVGRLSLTLSHVREVRGFDVRAFDETRLAKPLLDKVDAALLLLTSYDPVRLARIRRDLGCLFIRPAAGNLAEYHRSLRECVLDPEYLAAADTTPALIAGTIVHEATHARLDSLGFGYAPALRARIERLCFEAEIAFARRLPDGSAVIAMAQRQLAQDPWVWTDEAQRARGIRALAKLGVPRWLLRLLRARKPAA
jgi:hypothetical protein